MTRFVLNRLCSTIIVVFCVITVTFFLSRTQKGGAFESGKERPAHITEALEKKYGLDGTAFEQYARYLGNLARGDLGVSFRYRNRRVGEVIAQQLPVSLILGSVAFVIATCGGIVLGMIAAVGRNRWPDYLAMLFALLAISVPTFITGPLLIGYLSLRLGWFPPGGWLSPMSLVLPAICLAAPYVAYVARLMRNSMIEVLSADYVRTARAKGLTEGAIAARHAHKAAILPVVAFLGPLAANLVTGSIVVESVFGLPGAGRIFVNGIQNSDTFLLCGIVVVYCLLIVFFNLVVDLLYGWLDPRIRIGNAHG